MVGTLFSVFLVLMLFGVPIAFAIGLATLVPLVFDGRMPFSLVISKMFGGIDSFPLMAIPFFVLTGTLAGACNLTDRITSLAAFLVGRLRAGLAHVNVVAAMLFGGITGSAVAETAALGSILIPSMVRRGYPASYAAGLHRVRRDDRRADPAERADDHLRLPDRRLDRQAVPRRRDPGRARSGSR